MKPIVSFNASIEKLDYLNYWFVRLSEDILAQLPGRTEKGDFNQRLIIRLDDQIEWQAGVLALGEGEGLITVQRQRLKELDKTLGDTVQVSLRKDESEFGTEIPEEIAEYWVQVPESKMRFDQQIPAMKRYILNYVNAVKSPIKKAERTHLLLHNLCRSKDLNPYFRFLLGKED
ncbi:MAG: DUF1905 domain-containing protein [Fluviicola sp.]